MNMQGARSAPGLHPDSELDFCFDAGEAPFDPSSVLMKDAAPIDSRRSSFTQSYSNSNAARNTLPDAKLAAEDNVLSS